MIPREYRAITIILVLPTCLLTLSLLHVLHELLPPYANTTFPTIYRSIIQAELCIAADRSRRTFCDEEATVSAALFRMWKRTVVVPMSSAATYMITVQFPSGKLKNSAPPTRTHSYTIDRCSNDRELQDPLGELDPNVDEYRLIYTAHSLKLPAT